MCSSGSQELEHADSHTRRSTHHRGGPGGGPTPATTAGGGEDVSVMKCRRLVVDTAAFVKNVPLWEYGEELFSLPEVIEEIRDKQTRQRVEAMIVPITMRQPQAHSIRFVNEFSKKTGDYASLSLADVKVLALTYELEVETRGGSDHLRSEPQKIITEGAATKGTKTSAPNIEGFYLPSQKCDGKATISPDNPFRRASPSGTTGSEHVSRESFPLTNSAVLSSQRHISSWHLMLMNSFLEEHSYVSGHLPTNNDFILHSTLVSEYPQFGPSRSHSNSELLVLDNSKIQFENSACLLDFTFPHVKRWASHILSFNEDRTICSSSSECVEELLHNLEEMRRQMGEESSLECVQQNDSNSLQLDEKDGDKCSPIDHHSDKGSPQSTFDDQADAGCPQSDQGEPAHVDLSSLVLSEQSEVPNQNEDDSSEDDQVVSDTAEEGDDGKEESETDDVSEDGSEEEGWITPSNIKRQKNKKNAYFNADDELKEDVQVACMTADFAIQNVLKHIGLSIMGVDGKFIRHVRTYILRCHACFKTTSVMTKIFCPHCGNKTLKKVAVTVNPDGTQKIWINTKRPINTKGMKYSLPTPKGGKHGRNPILVEDQREAKRFSSKMSRKKVNPLHEDYNPGQMPFAVRDVYSRAAQLGYIDGKNHHHYYWEKRNPNEPARRTGKKKNHE
nr:RNA-binding protein NOB1-like isoform X1 [Procambarus clarkii]